MSESTNNQSFEMFKEIASEFASCMNDNLFVYNVKTDTYCITEGASRRFAIPGTCFHNVNDAFRLFVYPDDLPMLAEDMKMVVSGAKKEHNLRYRWLGTDGSPIWINCRGRVLCDSEGKPSLMIGCINEIGRRQNADNISGLLSGIALQERIKHYDSPPAGFTLRIGIDDLKNINERLGQEYGDFVLRKVAECIEHSLSDGQSAYRIVADEYLVLDENGGTPADAKALYHRIRSAVDKVVEDNHYEALYTISGGVVTNDRWDINDFSSFMKLSEFALSTAKYRGKNQIYYFEDEEYTSFLRKRIIRSELRKSVANDFAGFELYFQPIVMVENGQLYAAETLLRYRMSNGEMISPDEFIPILEDTGLIIPVGKWIIRGALKLCNECQKTIPNFHISINLSYIQLLKSPIFNEISGALNETGTTPCSLIVELTESGHLENTKAIQNVWNKLKALGVNIAIDDFGTGYSNLQNIGTLRPNIVKLDRSFTVKALQNDYEHQLMIHIIHMVHSIGLTIVVEGVETQSELEIISSLGPDFIQGYYYSKPCPRQEFMEKFKLI